MPLRWLAAAFALLLPLTANAAEPLIRSDVPPNLSVLTIWNQAAQEPAEIRLIVGDRAPRFSYLDIGGQWKQFSDLSTGSALLLIFGASESDLVAIEEKRQVFQELGVTPVAVVDGRSTSMRALQRRQAFTGPIITDPKRAIGGLFNSLDPRSLTHAPSFFVLDEKRRIRALGHGALPSPIRMLSLSASSLGRALPKSAWS
jgi:peroxiredoxin